MTTPAMAEVNFISLLKALLIFVLLQAIVCADGDRTSSSVSPHDGFTIVGRSNDEANIFDKPLRSIPSKSKEEIRRIYEELFEMPEDSRTAKPLASTDQPLLFTYPPSIIPRTPNSNISPEVNFLVQRNSNKTLTWTINNNTNNKHLPFQDSTHSQPRDGTRPSAEIVFPGRTSKGPKIQCENGWTTTFCTNVTNYYNMLNLDDHRLRQKLANFRYLFDDTETPTEEDSISNRSGFNEVDSFCQSRKRRVYPEAAKNINGTEVFVVNGKDFKQSVTVEICVSEGSTCDYTSNLSHKYKFTCEQHYVIREFLAFEKQSSATEGYNGEEIKKHHIKMPSCCKCAIRK